AELLEDLLPDPSVAIVEAWQAVHELGMRVAGRLHDLGGYAIGFEPLDPLRPNRLRLAHRYPDVGINVVAALDRRVHVLCQRDAAAGSFRDLPAPLDEFSLGPAGLGRTQPDVHADLRRADHQRIAHIVAGIAQEAEGDVGEMLV